MRNSLKNLCGCLALLLLLGASGVATQTTAAEVTRAFVNARLIPIDGEEISDGTVVVVGNRIQAVGPSETVAVPDDAVREDCRGRVIMPGLVCTHSHIGGIGAADESGPIQPGVRVADSINVRDAGFRRALAGGLTTLNIMPGSGHLIGGQTVYVKLRFARGTPHRIDDIVLRDSDGRWLGGLKMANGTNSMRAAPFPQSRGKSAFLVREQYIRAREYQEKIRLAAGDVSRLPPRDLHLEALAEAMAGTRVVHHHTHRHDDIMTVLRLSEEFGFRVVLHHVSEGWKVASEIAAAGAPCSVILLDSPGGKLEARNMVMRNAAVMDAAGVKVAFHTDDYITDSRYFLRMAALGVRAGLSRRSALRGLTLTGAEMLDLGDRTGSLTPGKDADLVILSGDPLSIYTKVLETWVEGERAFNRGNPSDLLYAVGGYGASQDQAPYFCCFGQQLAQ